ncbi:MAG: hypothetical protein DIZ77_18110 [endosymbiont of Seepiophila jonesi]|uniref:Uncharacterized protein n=1 Tax=endosymbiont of Lamellibrachia luymesi TaxID=2200907 RepID=A0A370DWU2_9GAMM|nr:MAG: hypothetical protein DIZ77_18110 [endosymbiont of Seepiophila jonesi]RDH90287.1 MAG: hypothetical protein DIZ79_09670 [endosymbiont of Lamellibrachia luymesi]
MAQPSQSPAKYFRLTPLTHGGLSANFQDGKNFSETSEDRLTELLSDNKELLNNADKTYSVSSNYFLLETSISMDNTNQYLRCLINKTDKGVYTLSRTTGTF